MPEHSPDPRHLLARLAASRPEQISHEQVVQYFEELAGLASRDLPHGAYWYASVQLRCDYVRDWLAKLSGR